ncbi:hypothetical protein MOR12E_09270 [Methylobacterium oryzae]
MSDLSAIGDGGAPLPGSRAATRQGDCTMKRQRETGAGTARFRADAAGSAPAERVPGLGLGLGVAAGRA